VKLDIIMLFLEIKKLVLSPKL